MNKNYRSNVCLLILNSNNQIFLGLRAGTHDHWQFPQGGVDKGESFEEAAMREFSEELGVDSKLGKLLQFLNSTHTYDFNESRDYGGESFAGQTQKYAVIRFLGADQDIKLSDVQDPEFSEFKWVDLNSVLSLSHPIRKEGYAKAIEEVRVLALA